MPQGAWKKFSMSEQVPITNDLEDDTSTQHAPARATAEEEVNAVSASVSPGKPENVEEVKDSKVEKEAPESQVEDEKDRIEDLRQRTEQQLNVKDDQEDTKEAEQSTQVDSDTPSRKEHENVKDGKTEKRPTDSGKPVDEDQGAQDGPAIEDFGQSEGKTQSKDDESKEAEGKQTLEAKATGEEPKSGANESAPPSPVPKSPAPPQTPAKDGQFAGNQDAAGASKDETKKAGPSSSYEAVASAFGKKLGSSSQDGSRSGSPAPRSASRTSAEGGGAGAPVQTVSAAAAAVAAAASSSSESTTGQPSRKGSIPTNQAAEEVPFDFNRFLEQMKQRSAAPVGEYVRSFIRGFARKPYRTADQIKLINDFLAFISGQMAETPPWSTAGEKEFENAKEAMEKLVMNRLYPFTFSPAIAKEGRWPVQNDDLERDAVLHQKMRLFEWVEEKHLDVPVGEHSKGFVEFGITELSKMNHYKAPRDKLICILNCSKVIFGLIRHLDKGEDADTFLPILIFIVLKAKPENLISNVEYINRFRSPERLSSESGYYLSSLMGAISFIEQMDFQSFSNLTQEEFEKNVEDAAARLAKENEEVERRSRPSSDGSYGDSGEEEARSIGLAPVAAALADDTRAFLQRTGEAARLGVVKPIGALGRFLSEATSEGARTPNSAGASDAGFDSANDRPSKQNSGNISPVPLPPGTPRTRLFGLLGEGAQPSPPQSASSTASGFGARQSSSSGINFGSWGRSFRNTLNPEQRTPSQQYQTPAPGGAGVAPPIAPKAQRLAGHFEDPNRYPGERARDEDDDDSDDDEDQVGAGMPTSPTGRIAARRQRQAGDSPAMRPEDLADMSAEVDRVHREKLDAAVETLKGIFPETEHDVCLMVLESCGGDVQAAIDKLLEMS